MNTLEITSDPTLLPSPSVSTFLPEEDASTYLLLPATPSPPPMDFIHPLTPSTANEVNCNDLIGDDNRDETQSSSSGSSGIGMGVPIAGTTTLYNNKNVYQNLENNNETIQENGTKQYANLNIQITKDTPGFVHWNWPLIRKCTFFIFVSGIVAMAAIVVAMIVTLPKKCNPRNIWYKGTVFYEIFPASFQDYNGDGLGDLMGLTTRLGYIEALGVGAIRLNSIFPAKNYPDHFQNVTTLLEIDDVLGHPKELTILAESLHARNMSLVLDLPLYPLLKELGPVYWNDMETDNNETVNERLFEDDNTVISAMNLWLSHGVDGFYVKGMEHFAADPYLLDHLRKWKDILGTENVLIVSKNLLDKVNIDIAGEIVKIVDLVDVYLDITKGTQHIASQIKTTLAGVLKPDDGTYIQWSLGGVNERRLTNELSPNISLAATLMELMLPGSPNIFYGDEIALQESYDPDGDHVDTKHLHHLSAMAWNTVPQFTSRNSLPWIPHGSGASFEHMDHISEMINLREQSPTLYLNFIKKPERSEPNTSVKYSKNDILILERWYPRRNTFASITNFGNKKLSLDLSTMFYSGEIMAGKINKSRVLFSDFEIGPIETIVVRLDK